MSSAGGLGASVSGFLQQRWAAACPLVVFFLGLILGYLSAPSHASFEAHSHFSDFFAAAAGVIATLFVAYALGARLYLSSAGIGILALLLVGLSEIAALAALSPSLPRCLYAPLMGLTIGGGLGAVTAALLSAARVLLAESKGHSRATAEGLAGGAPGASQLGQTPPGAKQSAQEARETEAKPGGKEPP